MFDADVEAEGVPRRLSGAPGSDTSPSGRVLASMTVHPGDVGNMTGPNGQGEARGDGVRVDLSCGRLDIWAGPPMTGSARHWLARRLRCPRGSQPALDAARSGYVTSRLRGPVGPGRLWPDAVRVSRGPPRPVRALPPAPS
jgi:hypothetical protein